MQPLRIDVTQSANRVRVRVRVLDRKLDGHRATLKLVQKVVVDDSRAVNGERSLAGVDFTAAEDPFVHDFPAHSLDAFSYSGEQIDIELHAKVVVDDGIFWDTTLSKEIARSIGRKPRVSQNARELVDPKDLFSITANLAALSPVRKLCGWSLVLLGTLFVAVNSFLGCHDQFANPGDALVYSHDGVPPFVPGLIGSGVIGFAIWRLLRWMLRGYARFHLRQLPDRIDRDTTLRFDELVEGRPRVALWGAQIRVVAWNAEHGQYKRGSGTQERTVSFSEPTRAVVLYDERVEMIPRGERFEQHFAGEITFGRMFDALYPPSMATTSHGLSVNWVVQLLHDDFVDLELPCSADPFVHAEFYDLRRSG